MSQHKITVQTNGKEGHVVDCKNYIILAIDGGVIQQLMSVEGRAADMITAVKAVCDTVTRLIPSKQVGLEVLSLMYGEETEEINVNEMFEQAKSILKETNGEGSQQEDR